MEFLEIVSLLTGWHFGIFHNAAGVRIGDWVDLLRVGFCVDCVYDCADRDFWRSDVRMAVSGMYYRADQRRAASVSGNCRAIFV